MRLLAAPEAERTLLVRVAAWEPEDGAVLLVGPEGGLAAEEEARCRRAGFEAVGLGPRTLRFETAAVAGLAVLSQAQAAAARAAARR